MFLDTKWAITPGIKLYSYTVYHNKPEIFANWFLDGIRYLGRHHAVSIPITTTWFTTSGTKLYSYTVYHNNSVLLFDTVNAFFVLVKDGFLSLFSTTRSDEHTSELQSLMRISYAVFCLQKKKY